MTSYAAITKHHTDGPQPKPDTALLNTAPTDTDTNLPDVDHKLTVVPASFKDSPVTETSSYEPPTPAPAPSLSPMSSVPHTADDAKSPTSAATQHRRNEKVDKAKQRLHETVEEFEEEAPQLWAQAKERILRPGTMGGLVGLVNVGLIGAFGYQLYNKPHLRSDTRTLATAGVSALILMGAEGYVAESYRNTPRGRAEEKRARQEGALWYAKTKDVVLRPGVLGGLVGVVNIGVLGGVGYASYLHWDKPVWDRRTVSAVTVGLIALFAGEGYLGEEYKEKEYPKRK